MAVFDKCCGCLPLQTGTIIIGVFHLICAIYLLFTAPAKGPGSYVLVAVSICVMGLLLYGAIQVTRISQ